MPVVHEVVNETAPEFDPSVFAFIDPVKSLLEGPYKYRTDSDRQTLHCLQQKLVRVYGENSKFKDTTAVLKYIYMIEDGGTIHNLRIERADLFESDMIKK